jgi:hypothetical protein
MGEFFYNNTKHSLTQQTLFMVDTGRHPQMGFEPQHGVTTYEDCQEVSRSTLVREIE